MGCSSPDGLGWTCDAVGKRIEAGQGIAATWRPAGPVSDEIAAQLGEEPYYAGNLTYAYTDGDLKGTVSLDNADPAVGDTITATVTGANVPDDKLIYQWVKVKGGSETSIDEGGEDSTIAPLCEGQGNGDALSVPSENDDDDADEAAGKTDGKASADSETEGGNTASADDAGAKEEEASGNIVQEEPTAA